MFSCEGAGWLGERRADGGLTALKMETWPGWAWTCSIMKDTAV